MVLAGPWASSQRQLEYGIPPFLENVLHAILLLAALARTLHDQRNS